MRLRFTRLPSAKAALLLAAAFLTLGSVVQASIRGHRHHPGRDVPRARFEMTGRLPGPLWPGVTRPIDVALSNNIRHELWISDMRVRVAVDSAHAAAGCSASRDFVVTQLPRATYPIRLPGRSTYTTGWPAHLRWPGGRSWRLHELGVAVLPSVTLIDLPQVDQDGCKGALLRLALTATSRLHPIHAGVRAP